MGALALIGTFFLGLSALSLIGYMIYGASRRHLLTVLSISFTAGSMALLISIFLGNYPG